jgi:GntR family transcriptional regulator
MLLDRRGDRPLYLQIADLLRTEIAGGTLGPGERLPSEHSLMRRFGASRDTVRRAVAVLRTEGRLDAERGRGVYVRAGVDVTLVTSERLRRRNRSDPATGSPVVGMSTRRDTASSRDAARLGLREGDPILVLEWRMGRDGRVRHVATSRLSARLLNGSAPKAGGPEATYGLLEQMGYRLGRFEEQVGARMATADEARALGIAPGTPVLCVARTAYTKLEDRPIEVCDSVMAADGFELRYEVPAK